MSMHRSSAIRGRRRRITRLDTVLIWSTGAVVFIGSYVSSGAFIHGISG